MVKEHGRLEVSSIQVIIFVPLCVVVFLTNIFVLRGLSIISSVKYLFVEPYPLKNIYQMEISIIA